MRRSDLLGRPPRPAPLRISHLSRLSVPEADFQGRNRGFSAGLTACIECSRFDGQSLKLTSYSSRNPADPASNFATGKTVPGAPFKFEIEDFCGFRILTACFQLPEILSQPIEFTTLIWLKLLDPPLRTSRVREQNAGPVSQCDRGCLKTPVPFSVSTSRSEPRVLLPHSV
jgi:hypothetical protein